MLQDTLQKEQAMGSGNAHWSTRPNNEAGVAPTGDKMEVEKRTAVEIDKDAAAEYRQMKSSTATTVSSEWKHTDQSSNVHTSSGLLKEETDPTESPSEMFDEPDRKCTDSPIESSKAVYGSLSVHSTSSASSAEEGEWKKNVTATVDLEAMGGQFNESYMSEEAASFHNPENDMEANFINHKVMKAHSEPPPPPSFAPIPMKCYL